MLLTILLLRSGCNCVYLSPVRSSPAWWTGWLASARWIVTCGMLSQSLVVLSWQQGGIERHCTEACGVACMLKPTAIPPDATLWGDLSSVFNPPITLHQNYYSQDNAGSVLRRSPSFHGHPALTVQTAAAATPALLRWAASLFASSC